MHLTHSNSTPPRATPRRIGRVGLRVRDLGRSAGFYGSIFNLERCPADPPSSRRCRCRPADASPDDLVVELTAGRPMATGSGLDHLAFEFGSYEQVKSVCERAGRLGCRAAPPRPVGATWRGIVFDPDGHKIHVTAPMKPRAGTWAPAMRMACDA